MTLYLCLPRGCCGAVLSLVLPLTEASTLSSREQNYSNAKTSITAMRNHLLTPGD